MSIRRCLHCLVYPQGQCGFKVLCSMYNFCMSTVETVHVVTCVILPLLYDSHNWSLELGGAGSLAASGFQEMEGLLWFKFLGSSPPRCTLLDLAGIAFCSLKVAQVIYLLGIVQATPWVTLFWGIK